MKPQTTTNRRTGSMVLFERSGGWWRLWCDHGERMRFDTGSEARYYFRHPEAWCSRCRLMTKQATNKENAR